MRPRSSRPSLTASTPIRLNRQPSVHLISTDELVSQVTLDQYNPPTSTTPVCNFAMARVRYQSTEQSELVRVFFRIFQAATTSTAYGPNTYGSVSNSAVSMSGKIPVFGVDGAENVVAIPCFASARVLDPTTLDQQEDDKNVVLNGIAPHRWRRGLHIFWMLAGHQPIGNQNRGSD